MLENETRIYLFTCPSTQEILKNVWSKAEIKLMETEEAFKTPDKGKQFIDEIKKKISNSPQEYLKVFMGLIQKENVKKLKESIKLSENRCKSIILNFYNLFREQFHNDIWKLRCKEVIIMEETLGISAKMKKTKTSKKSVYQKRKPRIIKEKTQQTINIRISENTSMLKIEDKIKEWI